MNRSKTNRPPIEVLEGIFLKAIEIDSAKDRQAFIERACGENVVLRTKVEQMLQAHLGEDVFLDANDVADSIFPQTNVSQSFGEFEVIREIGRGGMGIVYEAQQPSLNRRVALKVLSIGLHFSKKSIARFQREAEAAARLHHTNIVPIHTTGVENQIPFYAMELVRGPSLDRVLDEMRGESSQESVTGAESQDPLDGIGFERLLDAETIDGSLDCTPSGSSSFGSGMAYYDNAARMFAEVADALEHAHQEGVIHRDIKPSNLLVGPDGRIHINDFGLARILEEPAMTTTGELMGSPRYMSPEQISVEAGEVDHRADIYSLGLTLYELITLKRAYDANERDRIFSQILNKEPTAPRKINARIPVDLETICQKAIQKSPTDRYQRAAHLAGDLRRFVDRRSVTAKRVGWFGRSVKWCRRNRSLAAVTAILLFVLAVGSVWFTIQEVKRNNDWEMVVAEIESRIRNDDAWQARLLIDSTGKRFPQHHDELEAVLSRVGREMRIESKPAGAEILVRPFQFETGEWLSLGTTPIQNAILPTKPFHEYHVRAILDGEGELITAQHTGSESHDTWSIQIPSRSDMVVVGPNNFSPRQSRIAWRMNRRVPLGMPTFQIDTHEVTNGQFQDFVNAGGYKKKEYWRDTLGDDWKDIVKGFKDVDGELGPSTWANGTYPPGTRDHPVVGVSWYEAMAYAHFADKQLPTLYHWLHAANFSGLSPEYDTYDRYNIGRKRFTHRAVSDSMRSANHHGVLDMVGNVKEWCLNEAETGYRFAMGGSWQDDDGSAFNPVTFKPTDRRPDVGFRCAVYESNPEWSVAMPVQWREIPTEIKPIPREYVEQFEFDQSRPWNSSVPETTTFHGVEAQYVEFDAGYGKDERIGCYIIFPDRAKYAPPFQVMIGTSPIFLDKNGKARTNAARLGNYSPMMSGGRVLVLPTFWGRSHNRKSGDFKPGIPSEQKNDVYIDGVSKMAKDLIRTVDFLHEEYPQIGGDKLLDTNKLIFVSCGCLQSECMVVADKLVTGKKRFAAAFFSGGGIHNAVQPPAVDQLTYLPHLDTPAVIINWKGFHIRPHEYSQKGMLNLLPLPPSQKKLYAIPKFQWGGFPREHLERECNSWLNQLEALGTPLTVDDGS